MFKKERIDRIYEILIQFEKLQSQETNVTEASYRNYIDRLVTWYIGYGNEEIEYALKGLYKLGIHAEHDTVRRIVFHIIDILDKEVP